MPAPPMYSLKLARDYTFSRALIWECLTDEVLLAGWLGDVSIEDRPGGPVAVTALRGPDRNAPHRGTATRVEPHNLMVWSFDDGADWTFQLEARSDDPLAEALSRDPRGHTRLCFGFRGPVAPDLFDEVSSVWSHRLDDLGHLLRGRPAVRASG